MESLQLEFPNIKLGIDILAQDKANEELEATTEGAAIANSFVYCLTIMS